MPYTPFSYQEIRTILQLSEASDGHAGERHVTITNAQLWDRVVDYQGSGIAARTSFLKFDDQINAMLALLNAPENDAGFEAFRCHAKPQAHIEPRKRKYTVLSHTPAAPIPMRYGIGGGAQTFPCRQIRLVIDKNHERPRQMHVVTCFGEMG